MNKLEEARLIINDVDKEMIELFKKRMNAARLVLEYKKENDLPIYDEVREKALIEKNKKLLNDEELEEYYLSFLEKMLEISKEYQYNLLNEEE